MKRAFAPTFAPPKNTTAKNTVQHANPVAPPNAPLGNGAMVQTGSTAWSSRVIFARDLEPIVTHLEPSPTGPRLVIESLELLAAKTRSTATA
jgi:hypothetical protein